MEDYGEKRFTLLPELTNYIKNFLLRVTFKERLAKLAILMENVIGRPVIIGVDCCSQESVEKLRQKTKFSFCLTTAVDRGRTGETMLNGDWILPS